MNLIYKSTDLANKNNTGKFKPEQKKIKINEKPKGKDTETSITSYKFTD